MSFQINKEIKISENRKLLDKAKKLEPEIFYNEFKPKNIVKIINDKNFLHEKKVLKISEWDGETKELSKDEEVIIDFGIHLVGNVEFNIVPIGSPPDAPLFFEMRLGEVPIEVVEDLTTYDAWISKSWLQQEQFHVDIMPKLFKTKRRYSFRYLKLKIIDTSPKYGVKFVNVKCHHGTSAKNLILPKFKYNDEELKKIDEISIKTLQDCMQSVFEDGPKRDRRFWLGDLYLQAQVNYVTYNNLNLVKRCLYLFASQLDQDGRVCANLFVQPKVIPDDTYLVDYSLHFINTIYDYYQQTKDKNLINELWKTMEMQLNFARTFFDKNYLAKEGKGWWAFFDWNDDLIKSTAFQGLYCFTLNNYIILAKEFDKKNVFKLKNELSNIRKAAYKNFLDKESGLFIAGNQKQISWLNQIWMVLGKIIKDDEAKNILMKMINLNPKIKLVTPYAHHFFILALVNSGLKKQAEIELKKYWGKMVKLGADTFWELFDPNNLKRSPYGSYLANSYCHAWSCTPTYFIRKKMI